MGRRPARDRCELVKFGATDGVELPGLLYEPDRRTRRAAVWLHGTGGASIFESNRTNPIACEFTSRGIAYLIENQDRDGNWDEPWYTAVGFPRVFYLRYHGYRAFFPLFALARYRRLSLANSRRVAFGL